MILSFKHYLVEAASGKNLHLEHLEDAVINDGSAGAAEAVSFIESIVEMLSGNAKSRHGITVKWDGAPAVFCGINPENGKFFVGTKSVFNVSPKINYTDADIDRNHKGGLAVKLKVALKNLSKLNIKTVLQGDLMYTSGDLVDQKIDGEDYVTFTPNTITYAVKKGSDLAKTIARSEMGIVFHTEYTGDNLSSMVASFGPSLSSLTNTPSVWFSDAEFRDESGVATFTAKETTSMKTKIAGIKRMMDRETLSAIDAVLSASDMSLLIKTYYNTLIRTGNLTRPSQMYSGFRDYVSGRLDVEISQLKTDRAKKMKEQRKKAVLTFIRSNSRGLIKAFSLQEAIRNIKLEIVQKIQQVKSIGMFLRTDNGFEVTAPEGYVAIDRSSNRAYKLVDRMTFSRANFNTAKNWETG